MAYRLQHHDLISCSTEWGGKPTICWLRLFHDTGSDPKHVAVLTEVPGNPGQSIANAHEILQETLVARFGVDRGSLTTFQVWPADCSVGVSWWKVDQSGHWVQDVRRRDVERLVAQDLPDLPAHDELYRQVLDLGGGLWQEDFRSVFEAYPVHRLPPPHNPSSCAHHERFEEILASMPGAGDHRLRALDAGRDFLESLTTDDLARCRYHDADWRAIAEESVRILDACGDRADTDVYHDAARQSSLPKIERGWLCSLFVDPVFIGDESYTSGQHRGCALRFSGAERAAIHTDDESLGMVCLDWVYGGDG